jgi:hypothetical protein
MRLKQAPSSEIPIRENRLKFIPWVGINLDDKDLHPIYISIPKPPPDESIDGYGLPPEEQYFRRKEWPVKLTNLYKNVTDELKRESDSSVNRRMTEWKIYLRFWEYLEKERENYEEEIKFIKHMWWWRTYGYWFWNDGEITFVPPDYFDFLNCYIMGDGDASVNDAYPEYRDKDRRKYTYKWYLENTDETFAEYDEENIPIKRHGEYEMDNIGDKIFFGMSEPKTRRSGATHQALHKGLKTAMTGSHKFCTIVSLDGDNAETHYKKKLRPAWWTYPFFLKPISPSPRNAMSISFGLPEGVYGIEALESTFTFTKSAGEKKNDGDKINGLISDEEGKSDMIDIHERWSINRLAMATGGGTRIWGWSDHPSTVEDMTKGGAVYQALCAQSDFYNRDPSKGQTISGLGLGFWPNYDGLEGFIDKFGMSVIDTPTERQIMLRPDAKFAKLRKGARQVLQDELDNLLRIGTPEAMKSYRSLRRKQPMCYADCWRGDGADTGFDIEIIEARIAELNRMDSLRQSPIIRGFFKRQGDSVIWVTDPEGRFEMVRKLPRGMSGRKMKVPIYDPIQNITTLHWAPAGNNKTIVSADPFGFDTQSIAKMREGRSRQSDGGIAGFWIHDTSIDISDNVMEWESQSFILSYRFRPNSSEDFNLDVLLACIYLEAPLYAESNKGDSLFAFFFREGYGAYLLYGVDITTGKRRLKPGFFSLEASKNELFTRTKDYIRYRGHKENFLSYLRECRNIAGPEDMRNWDRFTSHGGCLLGIDALAAQAPPDREGINLGGLSLFKKRQY